MDTVVFLTTQTSATASIWRIIEKITNNDYKMIGFDKNKKDVLGEHFENIPLKDHIVLHNRPDFLQFFSDRSRYKYVVNFRDPRDRLCNSYHWMQQHPHYPGEPENNIHKRASDIRKKGIDQWVLENANPRYERNLLKFVKNIDGNDVHFSTYASLCLNFDSFITGLANFLDIELNNHHENILENERVEKISQNPKWIGGKWSGSDVMPGRYKRELKESTIENLNSLYSDILVDMADLDKENSQLYLDGVNQKGISHFLNLEKIAGSKTADVLREVALGFEKSGDMVTAEKIMEKAYFFRPQGPVIKRKLNDYRQQLAKQKE